MPVSGAPAIVTRALRPLGTPVSRTDRAQIFFLRPPGPTGRWLLFAALDSDRPAGGGALAIAGPWPCAGGFREPAKTPRVQQQVGKTHLSPTLTDLGPLLHQSLGRPLSTRPEPWRARLARAAQPSSRQTSRPFPLMRSPWRSLKGGSSAHRPTSSRRHFHRLSDWQRPASAKVYKMRS